MPAPAAGLVGTWTWTDAWIFIGVILGIRVAFIYIATKAFILMIPDGDVCVMCNDETLPIQRDGWWRLLGPRFRRSWCLGCGWEGVLPRSVVPTFFVSPYDVTTSVAKRRNHAGQLPLNSKKSSK